MIKINEQWSLRADNLQFVICKTEADQKGKHAGRWFYSNPEHALQKAVDLLAADGVESGSLSDVIANIEKIRDIISDFKAVKAL